MHDFDFNLPGTLAYSKIEVFFEKDLNKANSL